MSKGDVFETDLLKLIFNGTPIDGLAENDATSPNTQLYVALHSADPTESGGQNSSEVSYGGYTRIGVSRSPSGWAVVGDSVSNNVNINFPQCSTGTTTITHVSVGTDQTGVGKLLYSGAIGTPLPVSPGVVPAFNVGNLTISED